MQLISFCDGEGGRAPENQVCGWFALVSWCPTAGGNRADLFLDSLKVMFTSKEAHCWGCVDISRGRDLAGYHAALWFPLCRRFPLADLTLVFGEGSDRRVLWPKRVSIILVDYAEDLDSFLPTLVYHFADRRKDFGDSFTRELVGSSFEGLLWTPLRLYRMVYLFLLDNYPQRDDDVGSFEALFGPLPFVDCPTR